MPILKRMRGFTLIELMVTVAVLAIVVSIAIPSFNGILLNNRISTATDELRTAVQLTRSEAVKRKKTIVLCRAHTDFSKCADSGTDWRVGWLMMHGDEVLKIWEISPGIEVNSPNSKIEFLGTGRPRDSYVFKVNAQGCSNAVQHIIEINNIGSIKSEKGSC